MLYNYIGPQSLSAELGDEAIKLRLQLVHTLAKWAPSYQMILVMDYDCTLTNILLAI